MAKNQSKKKSTKAEKKEPADETKVDQTEDKPSSIELKLRAKGLGRENRRTVKDLLEYGANDDGDVPQTFLESMVLPGMLFILFCVTLALWHFLFLKDEKLFDSNKKQNFGRRGDL